MHSYDPAYTTPRPARRRFMMYTARAQQAFQHQEFFFEQKDKLACMLNAVGQEARAASFPACMAWTEIIDAVTQLLNEAQVMSSLTFAQIEQAGVDTRLFAEKVGIVEQASAEVRMRTMAPTPKPAARKRARRDEEEDEEMAYSSYNVCNKRNRYVADHDMAMGSSFCGGYADPYLLHAPAWTRPIYD
ncbi:hypothetical protein LTR53_003316 [Teratosphaeriaceae sp. CCFEE 6253]|nr:hypothetical protein LTR53_003316 [Teratosphaeriaceae sp. CCFEE 6253]